MKTRRKSRLRPFLLTLLGGVVPLLAGFLLSAPNAQAASLTEVTNFGNNPGNLRMYEYVPASAGARPPVVVAVHYCTGTGPGFHSGTEFASLADRYGFIVVYPDANVSGQCFDVSSPQALRHDGGSDPTSIASMVRSVVQRHGADASRVYVTGASSGAMMTNVLLGDYPDVFKAGASFMGVPFGCFATTDGSGWNSACANGQISRTPQQWGDLVRAAYPGYDGPRPRVQLWHGATDTTLHHNNLGEAVKQWTDVLGVSQTPVLTDSPQSGWTRTRYGANGTQAPVEAISLSGVGHSLPTSGMAARAIAFFGLDQTTPPPTTPPPTTPPPSGACRVTNTVSAWNSGLTDNITVTNTGSSTLTGWTLTFTLRSGQTITSGWNATFSPTSGAVTARNVGHNGTLAPGAATSIGFQATHTGDAGTPTDFKLNGSACQTG
ncbi:PHB depolymerase family esterase [Streptomyces sp. UH6]|uniref:extracellular catalytic domain type 1 short-chain-length polyhydroxyalkanoate depolymerase n=1 Tax=Streptomyces sp. UH6 TaxID=2748379 RepID=UPI0015D4DE20|nr:PHB depolymerase family esterase [Streptomyces sp. UH6]NYV76837.1 PHB depolymerase family esterase [Streptomyces sp. UH6]